MSTRRGTECVQEESQEKKEERVQSDRTLWVRLVVKEIFESGQEVFSHISNVKDTRKL